MSREEGGPAFPNLATSFVDREGDTQYQSTSGMSARDYFIAHAPISVDDAMLACGWTASCLGVLSRQERIVVMAALAQMRADYADAVIAEIQS